MSDSPTSSEQQAAWNAWNAQTREKRLSEISIDQRAVIAQWLAAMNRTDLDLIDVGCGAGWLCPTLEQYGRVTATDLSDEVLTRARSRMPNVKFVAGDFTTLELGQSAFDVAVTVEVLSHVADQPAFIAKLASLLRPNGLLMMATQNRAAIQAYNHVPPPIPGQLRKWVDERELRALLAPHFDVYEVRCITPRTNKMPWRIINNTKVNPILDAITGGGAKRMKERAGWGWTLMALARRRGS